jgi:hypothetical protein
VGSNDITPAGLPKGAPKGRQAELLLAAEMLAEFRHMAITTTEFMSRLAGRMVNNVLDVQTQVIPAAPNAAIPLEYNVAAGAIFVDNQGTHPMTVAASAYTGTAPTQGVGVTIVPAGAWRRINVASRNITIYGTAGDVVCFQVSAAGGFGEGGLGAVDGGGA